MVERVLVRLANFLCRNNEQKQRTVFGIGGVLK